VALKVARSAEGARALAREAIHAALALSPRLPQLVDAGWIHLDERARTATRVDPGAAPVAGYGGDARAFLALRWVEGRVLDTSATGPDALAVALRVARGVGEALADLHAIGTAHGDVKPANLVLADDGGVHLIDLGLAGPAHVRDLEGATPRYLARADADLGDARARDLLALGVVLAEIVDPGVRAAVDAVDAARRARLPAPIAALCAALLAPSPAARASAAWIADRADTMGARAVDAADRGHEQAERHARRVRASYLRVRREAIERLGVVTGDVAPWLGEAVEWARRARALTGAAPLPKTELLGPLSLPELGRWLTALVGSVAAAWPLGGLLGVPESRLAEALTALARQRPPAAWTFRDVEDAVRGGSASKASPLAMGATLLAWDASNAARLALAIARVPPDAEAIARVEADDDAPTPLALAAADALRLGGDYGRARSLVLRHDVRADAAAGALTADVLRRSGDVALAERAAVATLDAHLDVDGRARAVLARIRLDRRDLDGADRACSEASQPSAPVCEVAALCAHARGDGALALAHVARGEALAVTAEDRARIAAVRGYVTLASDPAGTLASFRAAVDHAVRAGAVVEEATYRTGEAAAAVDLGDLGAGIATARRAALLWEHLGRPSNAARALLAVAAAYATAGATNEAVAAAEESIARARDGGDARAEAYALWVIADTHEDGAEAGRAAAIRAADIIADAGASDEDSLRAAARLLRAGCLGPERVPDLDRLASGAAGAPRVSAASRLDWWGARANPSASAMGVAGVLANMLALAEAAASIGTRGPALAAGVELAARSGQGDAAQRLLAALGEAARELCRRAPPELAPAVRALPWVTRASASAESTLRPEQARDLEALIRSLGDHERLAPMLNRIVDALVLWTGVERGLLLMRAPDGRLVPRAARNLARADLTGEQMALSQTLARRALTAREPVVAVDAEGEIADMHASVHALKLRSVLAVPLIARGEPLGVVYLDDRIRRGAFGPRELEWARTIASLAALVIADARDQVLLRRAARRAKRASAEIAETLSLREAALDVAERELGRARGGRETRFSYAGIIGDSAPMRAMLKLVDRVTASNVPVLVTGESGSGKELVARAIHENGARKGRPFVGENCGAIPEALLESALFGHVRGAFTGADRPRAGLFEVADGGTLFLDEIGEMSLGMQTKLLRVLEDGMVKPVGTERARKVDVRVVAATHRDLAAMVKERTFREDLFYRLDIIAIRVPPLRERAEDIPLLVQHLLEKHGDKGKARITSAAMDRLVAFSWPGNVRQLQNEVRRALLLSDGVIDEPHLSPELVGEGAASPRETGLHVRRRIDQLERSLVTEALERTGNNQTRAAKLLGLSRFGLQKMMKRLVIE
jgi:transcriptional regulator with GAF, ATPase, and Fis domain